ncbi:hypothetical protein ABEB36_012759 [Hypothenemus hampei]|uniref:Nephrocystin 3-like N-terminal domain-containing protein n=1 Tax=Hypothenemus hampei TaxID=57062 RepID=A0ABD1ECF2_HYPHA
MEKISELLNDETDINAENGSGETILHIAIKKNYKDMVEFILKYNGVKIDIPNKDGETALDLAKYSDRQDIFQMLEKHNKRIADITEGVMQKKIKLEDTQQSNGIEQNVQPDVAEEKLSIKLYPQKRKARFYNDPIGRPKKMRLDCEDDYYHKGGLVHSLHGNIYQLKLQMLFLKRALDKGYEFDLGTEVEEAEKFDDIVFKYKTKYESEKDEIRFVQAKHKQDESKRITAHDLLTDKDGDFSLQKYFISYSKIKKKHGFNRGELKDFILYTNIKFDSADLEKEEIKIEEMKENDDILTTISGNSAGRNKLIIQKEHMLYEKLRETSDSYLLAKKLAQHIYTSKPLELSADIFKLYHVPLCRTVFQIQETKVENEKGEEVLKKYIKFRHDFLNGDNLAEDVSNFRNILQLVLNMENDDNAFQQELKGKKLGVSLNFGEAFKLESNPIVSEPEIFAEKIAEIINDTKENTINITRRTGIIKHNIDKLAGHILVQDEVDAPLIRFRELFFDRDNKLQGNLEKFKSTLKKAFDNKGIDFSILRGHKYKISNFTTCEETREGKLLFSESTLPNDKVADDEIKEFFEKLIFAVGQPNEVDLGEIITKEIGEDSQFNLLNADLVSYSFQGKMLEWFKEKRREKEKEGVWLNAESGKEFFDSIERQVNSLMSIGLSLSYSEKLQGYGIRFDIKNHLNKLKTFLFNENQIFHIITSEKTILSTINVYSALAELKNQNRFAQYNQDDSYIFMSLKTLLRPKTKKRVMDAFKSKDSHNLLIIDCKSIVLQNQIQEIKELYNNLDDVISNKNKKIIFISSKDNALVNEFVSDSTKYESGVDDNSFRDLTKESQQKLLQREIILQGEQISLNKLIDESNESAKNIIDVKTLVQLITNEEIKVGNKPPGISHLEGAYSELFEEVEIKTLVDQLFSEELNDVYIISGIPGSKKEIELIKSLKGNIEESKVNYLKSQIGILNQQSIMTSVNQRIQLAHNQFKEKDFKQACHNNSEKIIYWIFLKNRGDKFVFILAQIYNPGFYLEGQRFSNEVIIENSVNQQLASSTLSEIYIIGAKDKSEVTRWLRFPNDQKQRQFEENCKNNKIQFVISQRNLEFFFQELIKQGTAETYHLLKFEQNQLIWCKTDGSLENLSKYRDKHYRNTKNLIRENDLIKEIKDKNVLIIAGDPGMGKSTTLVKLYRLKYELESGIEESIIHSHWVIRLSLKDHLEVIRNIGFSNSKLKTEIVHNITQFLSQFDKSLSDDFAKNVLGMALVTEHFTKPLLIVFDGFDEILDQADRNKIISLLTRLKDTTKAKFWITSRLHCETTLEGALSTFAIRLVPMDDLTINKFIKSYLSNRLSLILNYSEFKEIFDNSNELTENSRLKKYTEAFLQKLREVFKYDVSKFIGTPLQLYLMLESSAVHFKEWIRDNNIESPDFSYLGNDIWEIYENFIDRKYKTYFKKAKVTIVLREKQDKVIFDSYHKNLAKSLILKSPLKESLDEFKDIVLSVGIVRSDGDNVEFIHPTFREYFAAKMFIHWIEKWTEKSHPSLINVQKQKQEYFFKEILQKSDYQVIRTFLNAKLLKMIIVNIQLQEEFYDKDLLLHAARENNTGIARFVLDNLKNVNVNAEDKYGSSILYTAVRNGSLDITEFLMSKGANIDATNKNGDTVLHGFTKSGNLDRVEFLIAKGANIDVTNKDGKTALHLAAESGNIDIVQFLVTKGANVDTKNNNGNTILHVFTQSGNLDIVKFLTAKGANIDATNQDGNTALHVAAESDNLDIVQFLVVKGAKIDATNKDGNTVLHKVAQSGSRDRVRFPVLRSTSVNSIDNDCNIVLHKNALYYDNLNMVQFLVAKGAMVDAIDNYGITVLHWAALYDTLNIVQYLIAKGAKVDVIDKYGITVLHRAAQSGSLDKVQFLVAKGAKVNATNNNGKTVLHVAAKSGSLNIVQFLIAKGAKIDAIDKDGNTVLHKAAQSGSRDKVQFPVLKSANVNPIDNDCNIVLDRDALYYGNLNIVQFLVAKGAIVDAVDNYGITVLHWAALYDTLDVVQFLVAKGAKVDAIDKYGDTILHKAAQSGSLDKVQFLVAKGAKVNAINKNGRTVLHMAAKSGNLNIVQFLVAEGANVYAIDNGDNTILPSTVLYNFSLIIVQFPVAENTKVNG